MGTRHLIAAVADGAMKLAQYGQWDGYPSGQGIDILRFLRTSDLNAFREGLRLCRFGTDAEIAAAYADFSNNGMMDMDQAKAFKASRFGHLSRDTGAKILPIIRETSEELLLQDASDFALDGLFCEWAYVIDFDAGTFEVYEGFQEAGSEIKGRWAGQRGENSDYAPVTLKATFQLSDLPSDEEFLAQLQPQEEPEPIDATFEATIRSWSISEKATVEVEFDPLTPGLAGIEPGTPVHVRIRDKPEDLQSITADLIVFWREQRELKNFDVADKVRDALSALGYSEGDVHV